MNNQQMLEMAAKSIGGTFKPAESIYIRGTLWTPNGWPEEWNPLEDDSDAFRLAVSLRLSIDLSDPDREEVRILEMNGNHLTEFTEEDPISGVRRAIVLAAARIGADS